MYQGNKQCVESQVDSPSYKLFNVTMYCEDSQNQFQRILNELKQEQSNQQDMFPNHSCIKDSREIVNQKNQLLPINSKVYAQPTSFDQFFPLAQEQSMSNEIPTEQIAEETTGNEQDSKRKDGHFLAQNLSSKARSLICKLLSSNKDKGFKKIIGQIYKRFLRECGFTNSQVVLLFSYLFLIENHASRLIYAEFRREFLQYLLEKRVQTLYKSEPKIRDVLIAKIEVNIQLLQYLFHLRNPWDLNFQLVQTICEPLFKGRQTKVLDKPLRKAKQIYERITSSTIKTSNTSTGCQVEL